MTDRIIHHKNRTPPSEMQEKKCVKSGLKTLQILKKYEAWVPKNT